MKILSHKDSIFSALTEQSKNEEKKTFSKILQWKIYPNKYFEPGEDLGFSWGGGCIFKKVSKILTIFFLGRPNK